MIVFSLEVTLESVLALQVKLWKRERVFEDEVFIENTCLGVGSKKRGTKFKWGRSFKRWSRGSPGQWLPETGYLRASAIVVSGTSGISPILNYRSVSPIVYTSRPRGFPVENELDELIPPLTIQILHSWTTFSGDLHTYVLQQIGSGIMAEYFILDPPSNSWTFGTTLRDPGVSCWKWIRRINSASDNTATSFLYTLFWRHSYFSPTATRTTHHSWTFIPVLKSATHYLPCLQRHIFRSDI